MVGTHNTLFGIDVCLLSYLLTFPEVAFFGVVSKWLLMAANIHPSGFLHQHSLVSVANNVQDILLCKLYFSTSSSHLQRSQALDKVHW